MVFCCLNQDLQDSDGFSGWIDLREGMENIFFPRRGAKGREERLFCCLNQDLLDLDGFSGWLADGRCTNTKCDFHLPKGAVRGGVSPRMRSS